MRRTLAAAGAILALSLTLSACSGDASDEATAAPATETSPAAEMSAPVDRTADVQAVAGDVVTKATETEPGRIDVETTIVDPRTESSTEAAQAVEVCNAVVELGAEHVSVLEVDGSTFVVAGHPSYGEDCTEV